MRTSVLPPVKGELKLQRFVVPYRTYGGAKSTLVFINGIQQSMAMWHSFVRRFSQSYRIVLFDFPNQGAGRIVEGSFYLSLEEQVDILEAVINAVSGEDELGEVVDVGKVQCKTILLRGENDTIVDLEDVKFLASQMPRSELRLIKDVGHFLHLEKEELLDVYEEILASL